MTQEEKAHRLTKPIITITGEVVQSSGRMKQIEEEADSINWAVREIVAGTDTQNTEVNQVVTRAAAPLHSTK